MSQFRRMLSSKIHRARVTQADVHYEGSITIPPDLLAAADILEYEAVHVWNVSNGSRFETYAITGQPNSRDICVNGAAARLVSPGDIVIIARFSFLDEQVAHSHHPKLVFVDENNCMLPTRAEVPGPLRAA